MKWVFILLSLCCLQELSEGTRSLKMVHLLYRHGDRAPVDTFPKDPNQEDKWPDGFGQLTQRGMRMEFQLGRFLKKRYERRVVSALYAHKQVKIRSSNSDRCLMSAESQLAGLYPPVGYQVWNRNISWQPTPVHTVPGDKDPLLRPWDCVCPRLTQLRNEKKSSEAFLAMERKYAKFFTFIRAKTGSNVTLDTIWKIEDPLLCEKFHNMKLASWVTRDVLSNLSFLAAYANAAEFTGDEEFSRLSGGPLLAEIVNNMRLYQSGQMENLHAMNIYSAHDTTVMALLGTLEVFNGKNPPYASAALIELYEDSPGQFSVDILYRNDSRRNPYRLKLPRCSLQCPLEDFIRLTRNRVSVNRDKECNIPKETRLSQLSMKYIRDNVGLVIGLGIVIVLMIVILIGLIIQCRKSKSATGYAPRQVRTWNFQDTDEEESDSTVLLKG